MVVLVPGDTQMELQSPLARRVAELELRVGVLEEEVGKRLVRERERGREKMRRFRARKKEEGK